MGSAQLSRRRSSEVRCSPCFRVKVGCSRVRVLVVTNMYPTDAHPADGTFVAAQVESLRDVGLDIEVLFLDRVKVGRQVYRNLAETARATFNTVNPDLVHVMYGGVMSAVVTKAIRERPVLVSFCGSDLLGIRAGAFQKLSSRFGVAASKRAAARAAGIVVKSENLLNALPTGIDRSRVWLLPNGVDLRRFSPRDRLECQRHLGWDASRRHVLFPADPTRPEKRFALAEDSVARLNQNGADIELHVLKGVPHEDVPEWLNAAEAILVTSTHEGSPNAVKEALACNVPVVSVDVGDVRARISGIDGCFIADPTEEDLAVKLGRVFEREAPIDARKQMAEISLEHVAEQLRQIYGTLTRP
jgi:teichuronic acid biosynthesis glycosyltransferase TuaC